MRYYKINTLSNKENITNVASNFSDELVERLLEINPDIMNVPFGDVFSETFHIENNIKFKVKSGKYKGSIVYIRLNEIFAGDSYITANKKQLQLLPADSLEEIKLVVKTRVLTDYFNSTLQTGDAVVISNGSKLKPFSAGVIKKLDFIDNKIHVRTSNNSLHRLRMTGNTVIKIDDKLEKRIRSTIISGRLES